MDSISDSPLSTPPDSPPSAKRRRLTTPPDDVEPRVPSSDLDYYQDDEDFEGLLEKEFDSIGKTVLHPSPPKKALPLQEGNTDGDPEESRTAGEICMDLDSSRGESTQRTGKENEEEEEDYEAQEAEFIKRKGYASLLAARALPVAAELEGAGDSRQSPFTSGAGFVSARGNKFQEPSEAARKRALEITGSPERPANESAAILPDSLAKDQESEMESTPLLLRTNSAHTPAAIAGDGARPYKRPAGIEPLRLAPKGKTTLLPARAVPQTTTSEVTVAAPIVAGDAFSADTAASTSDTSGFGGFTTGGGRSVSMPSAEDADAHIKRMERAIVSRPSDSQDAFTSGSGKRVEMPDAASFTANLATIDGERQVPKANAALSFGFASGSGKAFSMPSQASIEREKAKGTDGTSIPSSPPPQQAPAFDNGRMGSGGGSTSGSHLPGLTTGGGRTVELPSAESIARTTASLNRDMYPSDAAPETPNQAHSVLHPKDRNASNQPSFATPSRAGGARPTLQQKASDTQTTMKKPFRVPVRQQMGAAPSTPGLPPSTPASTNRAPAVTPFKKLDLFMTPRNGLTPGSTPARGTFKTPFKNGKRPDPAHLAKLKDETKLKGSPTPEQAKRLLAGADGPSKPSGTPSQVHKGKNRREAMKDSVFDLYTKKKRSNMQDYGIDPFYVTDELIEARLPPDIIFLSLAGCSTYKFLNQYGFEAAYEELVYYGACKGISQKWIENHWSLILWKMVSLVKAKPELFKDMWKFETVCDQLKYRYEREVLLSERSCIKRIQEKDSSASSPMILVVTQILHEERIIPPEPGTDEALQGIEITQLVATELELSDGWYRIRANLDESLSRAVWDEKIKPGMKLAVQSARLEGSADGGDPFEAYENAMLRISGNSTSRARWDAKLGFQRPRGVDGRFAPFVCTFRSLLPDGGLVPFVDVVVTRQYKMGYKGEYNEEKRTQDVWDEDEEKEKAREYEKKKENVQLELMMEYEKKGQRLMDIKQRLTAAAVAASRLAAQKAGKQESDGVKKAEEEQRDHTDVLEELLDDDTTSDRQSKIIRGLSHEMVSDTLQLLNRQMEGYQFTSQEEIRKELQDRCPPRVARAFCIVRVRDYNETAQNGGRDCQLHVSDPLKFGPGFFDAGKRYLVSNLLPGKSKWSSPNAVDGEIFLNTRHDTKWYPMSSQ